MSEGTRRRLPPKVVGGLVVIGLSLLMWRWRAFPTPEPVAEPVPDPVQLLPEPSPAPTSRAPEAPPPEPPSREDLEVLAGANGVVCEATVEGGGAVGAARLDAELPEGFLGVATVGAGHVVLSEVPDAGEGTLLVEGFAPASLAWGPEGCTPEPVVLEPARAAVTGVVTGADGEVTVEVCGRSAMLDDAGAFYADAVPDTPCIVRIRRHYGTFQWEVEETVTPRLGNDPVVETEAPGTLAVVPLEWDDTLQITSDWTGAGLEGRKVLSIDGVAPEGDAVDAHLDAAGSGEEEGREVTLELDDGRSVSVALRVLSFEDWLLEH